MRRAVKCLAFLSGIYLFCGTSPMRSFGAQPVPVLKSLSCSPATFVGAGASTCTIEFSAALAAAHIVDLTSTAPVKVPVPKSVTVPKRAVKKSFSIKIGAVDVAKTAILTATANGVTRKTEIRLNAYFAKIESNPASLSFGSVTVGKSLSRSITISSTGTAPIRLTAIDSSREVFKVSPVMLPFTLRPGEKRALVVTFAPKVVADLTATLRLTTNASNTPFAIELKGIGIPGVLSTLTCAQSTLRAGAQTDDCTVKLTGPAVAKISISLESNNAAVKVPSLITVPSGSSSAGFAAAATWVPIEQTATITAIQNKIAVPFRIQLTKAIASLSVEPSSISFDDVPVDSRDTQGFSLTSSGSEPITINSIVVNGLWLTVTGISPPLTLDPGVAVNAWVEFTPMSDGPMTGSITISSTASNGQPLNLPLNGTGVLYQVSLSWNAPQSSDPIAGYNIFRAEAGGPGYTLMNSELVTGTTYVDQTVANGTFYIYYVQTVDTSGASSTPSAALALQVP